MKTPRVSSRIVTAVLAGWLSAGPAVWGGEVVVSSFDDPNDATMWTWETWSSEALTEADGVLDAGGSAVPGSLRVTCNFPNNPGGYSQSVITAPIGGTYDVETLYTNLSFDVRLDPSSYPRVNGTSYGYLEMILRNGSGWEWNNLGGVELTDVHKTWTRLSFPVKAPASEVHRLTLKLGQNNLTNTVIYNIDNIRWGEATSAAPPPTMAVEQTKAGLNLLAASGGQYDRQTIATVGTGLGWVGSAQPVSYAMTIREFPNAATYPGFSTRFFLVPGTPGTEEYPDWTEPSCILVDIEGAADGSGTMTFHYKTNAPNSNGAPSLDGNTSQYFNDSPTNGPVGQLGSVTGASILGTWTVTMSQDTQITLTAPDGASTVVTMPSDDVLWFSGDITAYFGAVPGVPGNIGQGAVLSRVQVKSGATSLIDETFSTSPLNPEVWVVRAASAAGVSVITAAEPYYVSWTTPASGFLLQTNATVSAQGWGDAGLTDQLVGVRRRVLVPATALPSASQGYFRLIKP